MELDLRGTIFAFRLRTAGSQLSKFFPLIVGNVKKNKKIKKNLFIYLEKLHRIKYNKYRQRKAEEQRKILGCSILPLF